MVSAKLVWIHGNPGLKNGHFGPQNRLLGLLPCRMKFAKKFFSAILSIRKDALGVLHTCAEHTHLFRQALLSSNFVFYEKYIKGGPPDAYP